MKIDLMNQICKRREEKIRHHKLLQKLTVGPPLLAPCMPLAAADCCASSARRFLSAEQAKQSQSKLKQAEITTNPTNELILIFMQQDQKDGT